ncbi:putative Ig domain-containing protein [Actinocorallia herbida]|uniref:Putative Ig domain-containing protein n=1 Tax=Actinocorallia herbida TaxID=58109 RepID=A0A3N1CY21_9ACTN|nr:Ig domain-containing protein [Actinocorallia herbida]ROO86146.1 putative Ig domain-containing protein [Actinocorallia herbida]
MVTGWAWQADAAAIDFGGGSGVAGVGHLHVYYDGRTPVVTGADPATGALVTIRVENGGGRRFAALNNGASVTKAGRLDELAGGHTPTTMTPAAPMSGWIAYARVGAKLTRYNSVSPAAAAPKPIASTATDLVGVYRAYGSMDLGCLYLDASGNLVTWHEDGTQNGRYTYTAGLGLYSAEAWLDGDGMVHVFGLTAGSGGVPANTLKVLHQVAWSSTGAPVWSLAVARDTKGTVLGTPVPACVALVPKVARFALDAFPDASPSQFVMREGVKAASDQFALHTQDAAARWTRDKVRLPTGGAPHLVGHYVSSVTVLDGRGTPMPGLPVAVSADTLVEIKVDGASYLVGPGHGAALATDLQGKLTIATTADSLLPATLHVDTVGPESGAVIQPAAAVHDYLAGTGTLPSQSGVFSEEAFASAKVDGVPIIDPARHGAPAIKDAYTGIGQVFQQASGTGLVSRRFQGAGAAPAIHGFAVGSAPVVRGTAGAGRVTYTEFATPAEVAAHLDAIRALPQYGGVWDDFLDWAGDVWEGVKNGAIAVYHVAVHAVTSVFVYIGDKIVELVGFVLDTVDATVRAVEAVVREVVETITAVVDWLKSLFDFKDIWDTKTALESGMRTLTSYASSTIEYYGGRASGWFAAQEQKVTDTLVALKEEYAGRPLGDAANQPPTVTDPSGHGLADGQIKDNPQSTWMLTQVMGPKTVAATRAATSKALASGPITDAFGVFLVDLAQTDLSDTADRVLADLEAIVAGVTDPADPDAGAKASVVAVIDILEQLSLGALRAADHVVAAVVRLATTICAHLQKALDEPFDLGGPVNTLYRWIQEQAGVTDVKDLSLGGLIFLIAGFFTTTSYKLVMGVDEAPFPGGLFPPIAPPPWLSVPDDTVGMPPAELNALYKNLQIVSGFAGVFGGGFDAMADLVPVVSFNETGDWPYQLQQFIGMSSALLSSGLYGTLSSLPPVGGNDWKGADGAWTIAWVFAAVNTLFSVGTVFLDNGRKDWQKDTPIFRNTGKVEKKGGETAVTATRGPLIVGALSIGFLAASGAACAKSHTNPYGTAQIILSGLPGVFGLLRWNLLPKDPASRNRAGIAALLDVVATESSAIMLLAGGIVTGAPYIGPEQPLGYGAVGRPYRAEIHASGGTRPFDAPLKDWTVASGTLPTGLTLDPATGTVSGTPTAPGTWRFSVGCTDSYGPPQYSNIAGMTLTITP